MSLGAERVKVPKTRSTVSNAYIVDQPGQKNPQERESRVHPLGSMCTMTKGPVPIQPPPSRLKHHQRGKLRCVTKLIIEK